MGESSRKKYSVFGTTYFTKLIMKPLTVECFDFFPTGNSKSNYTSEFEILHKEGNKSPILRRGCKFVFSVTFDREYQELKDVIKIVFTFGKNPNFSKGTLVFLKLNPEKRFVKETADNWDLCFNQKKEKRVEFIVYVPAVAPVGIWKCFIKTKISRIAGKVHKQALDEDIYILFNPWCKHDEVYMPNKKDLDEYILNSTGKLWGGSHKAPHGRRWYFGQFEEIVLPTAVLLIERSGLSQSLRGSAIFVSRKIAQMVNSADRDKGVLAGRWTGSYAGYTAPSAWSGSVSILTEYIKNNCEEVRYGQCWVFSGLVVTICRALGIPCRSVTNYESAHDTDMSLTIDTYYDEAGNVMPNTSQDSIWNYHVWNDVWMSRPDLPFGYGGWQAIDATPQERSQNMYQCGPASVEAIRNGDVGLLYDTPFVFTEVNADRCFLVKDPSSSWGYKLFAVDKTGVGKKIVTKLVGVDDNLGDSDVWDITTLYKHPEGSPEERLSVKKAANSFPKSRKIYGFTDETIEDIKFQLTDIETIKIGEPFQVVVKITNTSNEARAIRTFLSITSVYYRGVIGNLIKKTQKVMRIEAGEEKAINVDVSVDEYLGKLVEHGLVKTYAIANIEETKQIWSGEDTFHFIKPPLILTLDEFGEIGEKFWLKICFENPLSMILTECTYTIEGSGLEPKTVKFRDVFPKEKITIREEISVRRRGYKKVVVTFNSKHLTGISGATEVIVK